MYISSLVQTDPNQLPSACTDYLHWTVTLEVVVIPSTMSLLVAVQRYSPLSLSVTPITTSSLLATRVAFSLVELIVM